MNIRDWRARQIEEGIEKVTLRRFCSVKTDWRVVCGVELCLYEGVMRRKKREYEARGFFMKE